MRQTGQSGGDDDLIWVRDPRRGGIRPPRRMSRRGKLTLMLPLVAVALGVLALRPEASQIASLDRWLALPEGLRLGAVQAGPAAAEAPDALIGLLPVAREAFEGAVASADWLPRDPGPGTRLWETLPPGVGTEGGVPGPLRVEYTLDVALGRAVFRVLERARVELGHVVILDPRSFDLLAYASTDPKRFPPTRDYPAASLIKVVTAAAALDGKPQVAAHRCRFDGSPWRLGRSSIDPPRRGTEVSLRKALATSNNKCFAQMAVHDIGATRMLDVIRRFGLLDSPAPAHAPGRAEHPGDDRFALGKLGCGLAGCRITPLHGARLAGTLANGMLGETRWISRVVDGAGQDLPLDTPAPPRRVLTPELAAQLRDMLVDTTTKGTARRAFRAPRGGALLGPVRVAGKTGSLSGRNPTGRYEWFIGVAPAARPRVAVAVLLVQSELWWRNSSQVSAEIFRVLFCDGGKCSDEALQRWLPAPV